MSGILEGRPLWTSTRASGSRLSTSHLYIRKNSSFVMSKEFFWGYELNKAKKDFEWRLESETDDEGVVIMTHCLLLKQAILGETAAAGEEHIVEVETSGYNDVKVRGPILRLKQETNPHQSLDLYLPTPMLKFHLIKGSGPVHLYGQHIVEYEGEEEPAEEHLEEEEDENGEIDESPEKTQKRKAPQATKGNPKKMAKMDTSASDKTEESEPPEEEDSSPEKKKKKPRGRGKSSTTEEKVTPRKKK